MKGIIVHRRVTDENYIQEIAVMITVPNDLQINAGENNCISAISQKNVLREEEFGSTDKTEVLSTL